MKKIGLLGITLAILIFVTGCDQQIKQENAQLKSQISSLTEENTQLKSLVSSLQKENENLKEKATSPDNSLASKKAFEVTKNEFVANCNKRLSEIGLSFENVNGQYQILIDLSGNKLPIATMVLGGPTDHINSIGLGVSNTPAMERPKDEFLQIIGMVISQVMQLDDSKVFAEKWATNIKQGNKKSSFKVGKFNIESNVEHNNNGDLFGLIITPL